MKCIILSAGEGMRMRPLTLTSHKSMLPIFGMPILEHLIRDLPKEIDELVIVVGYLQEQIVSYFGPQFDRFRITYVVQDEKLGTYPALELCKPHLAEGERFLMMYADDLHGHDGLKRCIEHPGLTMLVAHVEDPRKFGVVEARENGTVATMEEKPEHPKSNWVSTGVLVLTTDVFKYPARLHSNGERFVTDSIAQMIEAGYSVYAIRSNFWLPIGYPQDLARAEEVLKGIDLPYLAAYGSHPSRPEQKLR